MAAVELGSTTLNNDANLQEYYKLEDLTGKNGNTLTNINSVTFNAAKFNNGGDGGASNTNKALKVLSALGYNNGNYSISLWVKLNTEISTGTYTFCELVDSVSGTTLCIDYFFSGGTRQIEVFHLKLGISSGNVQANQTLGTSVFHNLIVTWDGTTVTGYFDGTSFGTATNAGTGVGGVTSFTILDQRTLTASPASAIIDDVSLFNRVLTQTDVNLINNGPPSTANKTNFKTLLGAGSN